MAINTIEPLKSCGIAIAEIRLEADKRIIPGTLLSCSSRSFKPRSPSSLHLTPLLESDEATTEAPPSSVWFCAIMALRRKALVTATAVNRP